jgi:hypothetical protein
MYVRTVSTMSGEMCKWYLVSEYATYLCLDIHHCGIYWPLVSYCVNFVSYEDYKKTQKRILMTQNQQMKGKSI